MYKQLKGKAVYVYRHENGKNIPLPRALTRHLDGKPDFEIDDWMRWYAALHSLDHRLPPKTGVPELNELVDRFLAFLKSQERNKVTINLHRIYLYDVLPFFKEKLNMETWYWEAGNLYDWMLENSWGVNKHNGANVSLRMFYRWLQERGLIKHRHALSLRNRPLNRSKTPLKFTLNREDVLASILYMPYKELQMLALLGYFFSLRPDEVFGLRKEDFIAGRGALHLEASRVMGRRNLFSQLVVRVSNCRRAGGEEYSPSTRKPGGWVACFDARAAKLILAFLKGSPEGLLIQGGVLPDCWKERWKKYGIPDVTLKDLRRASIYWLGHESELTFVELQRHARHVDPKTTSLYTRRPDEHLEEEELGEFEE
jgi:integrase